MGSLGSQINQAQVLQSLRFYRRSRQQLEELTQKLAAMPDSEVKVSGLRSLGLALRAIGDGKNQEVFEQSLAIANKIAAKTQLNLWQLQAMPHQQINIKAKPCGVIMLGMA
jgi:hypothetical protein